MFAINRLVRASSLTSKTLLNTHFIGSFSYSGLPSGIPKSRWFATDSPDDGKKTCRKDNENKLSLKKCKPIPIDPTKPYASSRSSAPCTGPSGICAKIPKRVDQPPPKPPKPEGRGKGWILGTILAAAVLVLLYTSGIFESKGKPKKKEKEPDKKKKKVLRDPAYISSIPNQIPYLLVGGGTASFSAFRAIKSADPQARILIISNELFHPYMRPPLSKEMWFNDDEESVNILNFKQWNGQIRSLFYEPQEFYTTCSELKNNENGGVAVARGYTVSHIDAFEKIAYIDEGYEIHYDKCLIATGATPKILPVFEVAAKTPKLGERIKLFRNIHDFQEVYEIFEENKSVVIVGSGFLGSELACALARKGKHRKKVYQIFRENGVMAKILPEYLSNWTTERVKKEGVDVLSKKEVIGVKGDRNEMILTLTDGSEIKTDLVIVTVGVEPNTEIAEKSDLEVDPDLGGFVVNSELQARTDLFIAGDCACFYDAQLGRRRIEHFDQAVVTGRLAGENMTGRPKPYTHQSMFWSDLGPDIGYEAIGIVDSSLPTVGVFAKGTPLDTPKAVVEASGEGIRSKTEEAATNEDGPGKDCGEVSINTKYDNVNSDDYGKGVVFYLRDDVVVGIVLWNVFNRMPTARQVIKDGKKYDDLNEVAKLFHIHEE